MIQSSRIPVEGGSYVLRVTFKDDYGTFYEPIGRTVFFSLYALREDNKAWEIVNNRNKSQLTANSIVDIVLQGADLALLPKCTTKRRLILDWSYMRGGEATIGRDMVDFEVIPLPVLDPIPEEVIPLLVQPLYIKAVFESAGHGYSKLGILFNDAVDASTVVDGVSSIYIGDSAGEVISGVTVTWDSSKTIAWCNFDSALFPAGEWIVYISGNIRSVSGALLGASETMNGSGFINRTVTISQIYPWKREYADGSWEIWDEDRTHYYWDATIQMLWYEGPGEGAIFRKITITQNGGAHYKTCGGSGIGVRDIWAWDSGEPGVGVIRHYYTKGQADDTFTSANEVKVITD